MNEMPAFLAVRRTRAAAAERRSGSPAFRSTPSLDWDSGKGHSPPTALLTWPVSLCVSRRNNLTDFPNAARVLTLDGLVNAEQKRRVQRGQMEYGHTRGL